MKVQISNDDLESWFKIRSIQWPAWKTMQCTTFMSKTYLVKNTFYNISSTSHMRTNMLKPDYKSGVQANANWLIKSVECFQIYLHVQWLTWWAETTNAQHGQHLHVCKQLTTTAVFDREVRKCRESCSCSSGAVWSHTLDVLESHKGWKFLVASICFVWVDVKSCKI